MRIRTTTGSPCPIIAMREYAWNQSFTPWRESLNLHPYMTSPVNWNVPNGFNSVVESISDETGTDGRFRDCLHTIETNEFRAPFLKHRFPLGFEGNAYVSQIGVEVVTDSLGLRVPPSIDMDAYADEALAFMMPRLNEGLSLVNFVLELKDLKHMDPRGSYQRVMRRSLALRNLRDPKVRKDFSKELVTRMNGAALNANFGIVPFVKDIVQIFDDLSSLASRLEALKKYANKPQQRHYKRVIPALAGVFADRSWHERLFAYPWRSGLISDNNDNGGVRRSITLKVRGRWIVRPVYHATARYSYTLPEVDSQLEKIYAHLDTLGVRLDPSIIWNAIPFSFVVDWVVDVSGFLGSFARDNYPINVTLLDFCHSYKWHREAEGHIQYISSQSIPGIVPIPAGYPEQPGWVQIYKGMRSHYSRVRINPSTHTARIKGPRLRHAALAGALMLAKTPLGRANRYKDLSRLYYPARGVKKR